MDVCKYWSVPRAALVLNIGALWAVSVLHVPMHLSVTLYTTETCRTSFMLSQTASCHPPTRDWERQVLGIWQAPATPRPVCAGS